MSDDAGHPDDWELLLPFWIDTDAYTDRDRLMFCAGYEFAGLVKLLEEHDGEFTATMHRENQSRVRMAAGKFGRVVEMELCEPELDPDGSWCYLVVQAK